MSNASSQPQARTGSENPLPNGPAAAAILSAGIGCCVLGILAVLGDGSKSITALLTWYRPTVPLSGVRSAAILVWLISWVSPASRWRTKIVALAKVNATAFLLLAIGVLLTFPPFEDLLLGR